MLPKKFKKTIIKSKNPFVSVIIPAYNEEEDIEDCIKSLFKQTYKKIEILVIDDGSTDRTKEIVKKYKKIRLIKQDHKGPGEARNLGAKKAMGDIIVLIDADMILFPDYIEKLTSPVRKNKVIGSMESVEYNKIENKMQECWGEITRFRGGVSGFNSLTVRAILKKDFLQLGGFDSKYGYSDDQTFYYKYGIKFFLVKDAKCYHKTPKTFEGVYKQSRWIGSSNLGKWLEVPGGNFLLISLLYLFSPIMIPLLSIRQVFKIKKPGLIFFMPVFMSARYFGTLEGFLRKIFLKKNVR